YLGEGMVDLLSTSLDGVGTLSTVDPHALLSALSRQQGDGGELSPAEASALAGRFGAGMHVRGSVVAAGGRLRLAATLYDGSERLTTAEAEGAGEGEVFAMIAELVRELVAGHFSTPGQRLSREGALTTSSVEALRHYLAGERAFRAGEFGASEAAFRQATEIDPAFALAWYRLAAAGHWFERDPELVAEAAQRAVELGAELPPRDRTLLAALDAYVSGRADEAERLYREVTQRYPEEAEAWYGLGEVLAHHNAVRGRPKNEAAEPFARVLELDPHHAPALYHAAQIAANRRDRAAVERLGGRYLEEFPDSQSAPRVRVWQAILADDHERWLRVLEEAARDEQVGDVHWVTLFELRRLDWGEELLRGGLEEPSAPRARILSDLAALALARGQPTEARSWLTELQRAWGDEDGPAAAILLGYPFLPIPEETLAKLEAAVEAWAPPAAWEWEQHADDAAELRLYWLGQVALRRGDLASADRRATALAGMARQRPDHPIVDYLADALRAQLLARRGDLAGALAQLDRTHVEAPGRTLNFSLYYAGTEARLLRAELLRQLGRGEEAIRWYRSVDETCCFESLVYGPWTHLQRARIHDQADRRDRAVWHYGRFLDAWRDAEPALQPVVREVEQRLGELGAPRG
ncbi:MAG TPA: tetratricopeptide repeat protein, partial [Thermoanaerobaculia bacterium]|nr:tetratricopeptide repeat protein [Thermoanaerobaculia bacterium]